jgi:SAM-dependent methyltransferase
MDDEVRRLLRCPHCLAPALRFDVEGIECPGCGRRYPMVRGRPALTRHDHPLFPPSSYAKAAPPHGPGRARWLRRLVPSLSLDLAPQLGGQVLGEALRGFSPARVLVIGSGAERARLRASLSHWPQIEVVCCDVDLAADVDFYCDAHEIPLQDGSVQGVMATAVLEHVLDPQQVVAEIRRVLVAGGIVCSSIPFMQQVHEGRYDFTRFTLSGHRRLFHEFREVASGMVAGPGTALAWSLEHMALSLVGGGALRLPVKAISRWLFFWLKYLDHLVRHRPEAMDAASCTYFVGRVDSAGGTSDREIIEGYRGAGRTEHL